MSEKTNKRRAALRDKLVDLAEAQIAAEGLASLRARTLASQADCSVGAIYTIFDDLTALTLEVNGRTFRRLGQFVSDKVLAEADAPAAEQLVTMGVAYLDFAASHPRLWRALFEIEMSSDHAVPGWYLEALGRLFALIEHPLSKVHPDLDARDLALLTRALFSSVHGIVLLGLENRISAVPRDEMARMIAQLLRRIAT